jgi:DnaK suppressor protein
MDESRARALLRAERAEVAELLREADHAGEAERESAAGPQDYGDAAEALTEQAEDEAIVDDLRQRVAAIDRALGRLESGTYGRSVLSGKPIPDERLEADPAAELTVDEARAQR